MAGEDNVIKIFGDKVRKAALRADSFFNAVTGLGTSRDKMQFNRFARNRRLTYEELDALYSDDDMASRICDVVPEEELRQGFDVIVDSDDQDEDSLQSAVEIGIDVGAAARELGVQAKVIEGRVWGRAFGGSVLMLGANDGASGPGALAEPLRLDAIQSFDYIRVFDRRYVWPNTVYDETEPTKFGLTKTYIITPQAADSASGVADLEGSFEIHETRLVVFGGVRTSILTRQSNSGWDQSLLQRMQTVLTQYGVSWDALAHMLQDASTRVFKIQGFIDALAEEGTGTLMKRLDMMDMSTSVYRAVMLDTETEEYERQNFSWAGIKDPYSMLILRLASAARMPVTILMGQSPAGLSATGESDIRWFYDTIASSQENVVKPALEYIMRLIMLAKNGPTGGVVPESWTITFPALWQPTPIETAAIQLQHAQADQIYFGMGAANADEISTSRFTEGGFERTLTVNLEERRANLQASNLEEDIEGTPTSIVDLESDIAASRSMTAMTDVAAKVQAGEISPESGAAIIIASTAGLTFEEALNIVGEPDPVKIAAKEAMAAALVPGEPAVAEEGAVATEEDPEAQTTDDAVRQDTIRRTQNGKYELVSMTGKVLGTHNTREGAERQERVILAAQERRNKRG